MERTYKWLTYWGLGTTILVTIVVIGLMILLALGVDVPSWFPEVKP